MAVKIIVILLVSLSYCTSLSVNPGLYPTSIEKTIKRFNYCLNHIDKKEIFESLTEILTGKAKDEFDDLLQLMIKQDAKLKKLIDQYLNFAKSLKIKIVSIKNKENKARVKALFYDMDLVIAEKRIIYLKMHDKLWMIEEITNDFENKSGLKKEKTNE